MIALHIDFNIIQCQNILRAHCYAQFTALASFRFNYYIYLRQDSTPHFILNYAGLYDTTNKNNALLFVTPKKMQFRRCDIFILLN